MSTIEIIGLYKEGLSQRKIAKQLGCSQSHVGRTLRYNGVSSRKIKIPKGLLTDMESNTLTFNKISEKYGLSKDVLQEISKNTGIKIRYGPKHFCDLQTPDDLTKAYIAGLFDGEGTISIYQSGETKRVSVTLSNTDKNVMDLLVDEIGGKMYCSHVERNLRNGHKPEYVWKLNKNINKESFINMMLPFLRIKKLKAKQALEIIRFKLYRI